MGAGVIWWHSHTLQPLGLAPRVSAHAQVAEAKGKADEARLRAQAALDKANQTRARAESSNKELRELISNVKAFLSRECWHAQRAGHPCPALCGSAPAPHCTDPALCCTALSQHCMWAVPPLPHAALHGPCPAPTILCPPAISGPCALSHVPLCPLVCLLLPPWHGVGNTMSASTYRGGG